MTNEIVAVSTFKKPMCATRKNKFSIPLNEFEIILLVYIQKLRTPNGLFINLYIVYVIYMVY